MLDIGFQELVVICAVALVVVGPDNLPEFGRKLRKWQAEVRRGMHYARSQIEGEMDGDPGISEAADKSPEGDETTNGATSNSTVVGE